MAAAGMITSSHSIETTLLLGSQKGVVGKTFGKLEEFSKVFRTFSRYIGERVSTLPSYFLHDGKKIAATLLYICVTWLHWNTRKRRDRNNKRINIVQ
jgi:hypothetical protein